MSRRAKPRGETLEQAIRDVLRGVYYRHEFARRHSLLVRASDALFKFFPKSNEVRAKDSRYLISGKQPKAITDFLIDEFKQSKESETMKMALLDFLKKWRVLPVPSSPSVEFMPYPLKKESKKNDKKGKADKKKGKRFKFKVPEKPITDAVELFVCWDRIQHFENFAMSKLGFTEPIFMPLVNLSKPIKPILENYLRTSITAEHKMVLINWNQPSEGLQQHLIIWSMLQDLDSKGRKNIKAEDIEDNNASVDDKTLSQSRIPWDCLDQYLIVHDYNQEALKSRDPRYVEVFAEKYFEKEYKEHGIKWAQNNFATWRQTGSEWVNKYRDII